MLKYLNTKNTATTKYSNGFTLIETLIAIAVLMIAIAGPLTVANKALTASLYAKNQSIASFLAQETMETIKNTRDNNVAGAGEDIWLAGMNVANCIGTPVSNACDISLASITSESSFPQIKIDCSATDGCILYKTESGGYNHTRRTGDIPTIFSRYFYLIPPSEVSLPDYQVVVVVKWKDGTVSNAVTLSSILTPAIR